MNTESPTPSLLPLPSSYRRSPGRLTIEQTFSISTTGHVDDRLKDAVDRFRARLSRQTGMRFAASSELPHPNPLLGKERELIVDCESAAEPVQSVDADESYSLIVDDHRAVLRASNVLGVMHGFETLLQLVDLDEAGFFLPAVSIDDRPRFPWRGLMLDVTRHFMPVEDVNRTIDLMAAVKLNVLHLHLTDDQGFNIESRLFPKLHELGQNGAYYTQDEIRAIVDHAAERGIRVVPEFDVPGHTAAWFAAFPDLAGYPGEYAPDRWYGSNPRNKEPHYCPAMNPTLEESYAFLDALFGEMTALFPDAYFHIGGDEVTPHHWLNNPSIVEFMQANGFEDPHALQAYFNRRLVEIVQKHGKTMIGWDEVLHPDIPAEIAIQSWRGAESLAAAAKAGHPAILSNGYYLDLMYSAADHYAQDPHAGAAADLPDDVKAKILGGEACMWSEYVTPELLDDRLWPRLAGIAERFWSPATPPQPSPPGRESTWDVEFLYARFPSVLRHLTWTGMRRDATRDLMYQRLTGDESPTALASIAECFEPAKGYARRGYMTTSPMNRLVDTVPPESLPAREFARLCEAPSENAGEIKARIRRWKAVLPEVAALMPTSVLIAPYTGVVDHLAAVLDIAERAIEGWSIGAEDAARLEEAGKPVSEMIIAIVPAVKKLIG